MGQFSWITSDTRKSICNVEGHRETVFMTDNKGNQWQEDEYEGYGVFGGKDYYVLLAEMNDIPRDGMDDDMYRSAGIDLFFGEKAFISPSLNSSKSAKWKNTHNESCPDQGWLTEDEYDEDEDEDEEEER